MAPSETRAPLIPIEPVANPPPPPPEPEPVIDLAAERDARYTVTPNDTFVVTALAAEGVPHEVIARTINAPFGVKVETLKRHFERELFTGKADLLSRAHAVVAAVMTTPNHKDRAKAGMFLVQRLGAQVKQAAASASFVGKINPDDGDIEFTLNIGEHEPHDADDIGTRDSLDPAGDTADDDDEK